LDSAAFALLYRKHGGSGLGLTLGDIEEMSYGRIAWWLEKLGDTRSAEADALANPK